MASKLLLFLFAIILSFCGCHEDFQRDEIPLNAPYFPGGLAQSGSFMAINSTNGPLKYKQGAILSIDLNAPSTSIKSALTIPDFSTNPLVFGPYLILASQVRSELLRIPYQGGLLSPASITLSLDFAPYYLAPFKHPQSGKEYIFVAGLSSDSVSIVDLESFTVLSSFSTSPLVSLDKKFRRNKLEPPKFAVRGIKAAKTSTGMHLFVACEHFSFDEVTFMSPKSAHLLWMKITDDLLAGQVDTANLRQIDLSGRYVKPPTQTPTTPSASDPKVPPNLLQLTNKRYFGSQVHGFDISPDKDEIYVLLHGPDSLLKVDFSQNSNNIDDLVVGVTASCRYPIDIIASKDLVYVACFSEAVTAYDSATLNEKYVNRFGGRGPVKLMLDERHDKNRLYVAYYSDSSVGVFDLNLNWIGRLFEQLPEYENGGA